MELPEIIKNLYINTSSKWIIKINPQDIDPYKIQIWLSMNDKIRIQTRWLDKYVYTLPKKMYLSLAWSIIPKTVKSPFYKYIKIEKDNMEYNFILNRIRKQFEMADNDVNANKKLIIKAIEKDKINWFSYYGVKKSFWKKHTLDFNKMKKFGLPEQNIKSLDNWGL